MKASLHIETLKAAALAALAASNEETRYCLKGVLCEVEENHVTYVATNGHILFCRRVKVPEPNTLLGKFIVPLTVIKLLKVSRKDPYQNATYEKITADRGEMYILGGVGDAEPIDATFPRWRAIVPSAPYAHAMKDKYGSYQLDGSKLAVFNKIGDVLGLGSPMQVYNAGGPTLIYFAEDIGNSLGLVMPMRVAHDPKVNFRPEWI